MTELRHDNLSAKIDGGQLLSANQPELGREVLGSVTGMMKARHAYFLVFILVSILASWKTFSSLIVFSLHHEFSSHVILIPFISAYLLYTERNRIFRSIQTSFLVGGTLVLAALGVYWLAFRYTAFQDPVSYLPGTTLALVVMWIGGFFICYGSKDGRAAAFPLLFLLLMIPLPESILQQTISLLQKGSTDLSFLLFKAVGVPVFRQGFILSLPSVRIEVAQECSGIRSSIALFITCLLAARLFLRTSWKMALFVLLALPLAIVKNAIRIVTLTLLSIYVDPGFLKGSLHHDGGFVFFLLTLAILSPVLLLLQKSEHLSVSRPVKNQTASEQGLA
jgi:exosortase